MKTEITQNEYWQLVGLLTLGHHYMKMVDDIEFAMRQVVGEEVRPQRDARNEPDTEAEQSARAVVVAEAVVGAHQSTADEEGGALVDGSVEDQACVERHVVEVLSAGPRFARCIAPFAGELEAIVEKDRDETADAGTILEVQVVIEPVVAAVGTEFEESAGLLLSQDWRRTQDDQGDGGKST